MTTTRLPVERTGGPGRPTYSDAVRKKLLSALRTGMTRAAACGAAGIHRSTLYDWIGNDEDFRQEVEIAEDFAESRYTSTVSASLRAQSETVRLRAAEFWLDRRRPDAWREKSSIEITLPPEAEAARSRSVDDLRDELRALGEELLRRGSDRAR